MERLDLSDPSGHESIYMDNGNLYTHSEIEKQVITLKRKLLKERESRDIIAEIAIGRSIELIIAAVACFEAHCPFVISNINECNEYKVNIRRAVKPNIIIGTKAGTDFALNNIQLTKREESTAKLGLSPQGVGYFAATSGTTGKPKFSAIPREALVRLIENQTLAFSVNHMTTIGIIASTGFDAIISEVFVAYYSQASAVIFTPDDNTLLQQINSKSSRYVTHMTVTPTVASKVDFSYLMNLKVLVLAGEKPNIELFSKVSDSVRVINAYGPCEAAVCTHVNSDLQPNDLTNIGAPLNGVFATVSPSGELILSGPNVGLGYLDDDEFIPFEQSPDTGYRQFRTGDYVNLKQDGSYEYLGRGDRKVKVRGQLVDLDEVEQTIASHTGLIHVRMTLMSNKLLLSYIDVADSVSIERLIITGLKKSHLPNHVQRIKEWPRTNNMKIDDEQLVAEFNNNNTLTKSSDPITAYWEHLLGTQVTLETNFFDSGGDSLSIAELLSFFERQTGSPLDLSTFLESPTLLTFKSLAGLKNEDSTSTLKLQRDIASLQSRIKQGQARAARSDRPGKILLTGCTGRIGRDILERALGTLEHEILCLVRPGAILRDHHKNITYIELALEDYEESKLSDLIELHNVAHVIHCAAYVNHIYNFDALYKENVSSLQQLLIASANNQVESFVYLGSISQQSLAQRNATGYDQTKWACDQLIYTAFNLGFNAMNLRLPLVYNLEKPHTNKLDHFVLKLRQCINLGLYPNTQSKIAAVSTHDVSALIFEYIRGHLVPKSSGINFYKNPVASQQIFKQLLRENPNMSRVDYSEFLTTLTLALDGPSQEPLSPFKSLYTPEGIFGSSYFPRVDDPAVTTIDKECTRYISQDSAEVIFSLLNTSNRYIHEFV